MTTFAELGVPARVISAMERRGITAPFPIQVATVADGLAGRDLSGRAPTGSGKTLAFSIPLAVLGERGQARRPRGLVLVPTRELAAQVSEVLKPLAQAQDLRVATFFGGTSVPTDAQRLNKGIDIAVACPGRLADLVKRRMVDLSQVSMVVIDEADRMADMGFLPEVKRLLDATRDDRQTLLFSATLDGDVDVLVRRYQRNPVRHELDSPAEEKGDVQHIFWRAERNDRIDVTADIIRRTRPAIVFTRTKHGADRLAKRLEGAGVTAAAIHGNRSQSQRTRALAAFSEGRVAALVATDVAARGIHVDDVGVVVHFDLAGTDKDYVHRSGRTGRAGAHGTVVTLVTPETAKDAKKLQRDLRMPQGFAPTDVTRLGDVVPIPAREPAPAVLANAGASRPKGNRDRSGRRGGSRSGRGQRSGGGRADRGRDGAQSRRSARAS